MCARVDLHLWGNFVSLSCLPHFCVCLVVQILSTPMVQIILANLRNQKLVIKFDAPPNCDEWFPHSSRHHLFFLDTLRRNDFPCGLPEGQLALEVKIPG